MPDRIEYGASSLLNLTKESENKLKTCIQENLRKAHGLIDQPPYLLSIIYHLNFYLATGQGTSQMRCM